MAALTESTVEESALAWFDELGWSVLHGPDIAAGEPLAERESYSDVILRDRLGIAIDSLNPDLPREAKEEGGAAQGPAPRFTLTRAQ